MLAHLLLAACLTHACSNDVHGVLGDETLKWDPSEGADYYEVMLDSTGEVCAKVIGSTSYLVSGTPCDEINDGSGFRVRACYEDGRCSKWTDEKVEILPFSCLEGRNWICKQRDENGKCVEEGWETECEHKCYDWQPGTDWRRLPRRYDECP